MKSLEAAKEIVGKLSSAGYTTYFAGGYVRDMLMGHPSDDIDIATTAPVKTIQHLFTKTIPVGVQFGIVIVVHGGYQFEIATFRKEGEYVDGRRPTGVLPCEPEEDALRRDFTVNGLFYNPLTEELFDYVNGQEDLERKVIRAIGDPHQRFREDRLRMIRAVRYAIRFNFAIDPKTKEAILDHASELFPAVAIERIWQELEKMARFSAFDGSLLALHELHLLPVIFPDLATVSYKELEERLARLPSFTKEAPLIALLLELFPSYSLQDKISLCEKLKRSLKEKEFAIFYHNLEETIKSHTRLDRYDWALLYANPHFKVAFSLTLARLTSEEREAAIPFHEKQSLELLPWVKRLQNKDPVVKSTHLISRGITPGPAMGAILNRAERLSINELLSDPQEILNRLLGPQ